MFKVQLISFVYTFILLLSCDSRHLMYLGFFKLKDLTFYCHNIQMNDVHKLGLTKCKCNMFYLSLYVFVVTHLVA